MIWVRVKANTAKSELKTRTMPTHTSLHPSHTTQAVAGQLSLLVPYLGCGNETIRCGIVHILGALVAEVFSSAVSVCVN